MTTICDFLATKGLQLSKHSTETLCYQNKELANLATSLAELQKVASGFIRYIRRAIADKRNECHYFTASDAETSAVIEIVNLLDEAGMFHGGVFDTERSLLTGRFCFSPLGVAFINGSFFEVAIYHKVMAILGEMNVASEYEVIANAMIRFPNEELREYDILVYNGKSLKMIEVKSGICKCEELISKTNEIDFEKQIIVMSDNDKNSDISLRDIFSKNTSVCLYGEFGNVFKRILTEDHKPTAAHTDKREEPAEYAFINCLTKGNVYANKITPTHRFSETDKPMPFHMYPDEGVITFGSGDKADWKKFFEQDLQNGRIDNIQKTVLCYIYTFGQFYIVSGFIKLALQMLYGFSEATAAKKTSDCIYKLQRYGLIKTGHFPYAKQKPVALTKKGFFVARELVPDTSYYFNEAERMVTGTNPCKVKTELACVQAINAFLANTSLIDKFALRNIHTGATRNKRVRPMAELTVGEEILYIEAVRRDEQMLSHFSGKLDRYHSILGASELTILTVCETEEHAKETYRFLKENNAGALESLIFTDDRNLLCNFRDGFYIFGENGEKVPVSLAA